jgi:predicted nucleic acid-binding protein
MIIYWDSNVFLSFINKIPDRIQIIRSILYEISKDPRSFILTSSESIVEVANAAYEKLQSRLDPEVEQAIDAMWEDSSIVKMIDNGPHISMIARRLTRDAIPNNWVLKPKDAIHLASAYWYDKNVNSIQEFHTYDNKLHKYSPMIGIHICYPHTSQYRMDLKETND